VESIATQVLVIFIIRTRGNPFANRPNVWLFALSLAVVAIAVALPLTPIRAYLGFVPPPPQFYVVLVGIVFTYLVTVQVAKRAFYQRRDRRAAIRLSAHG
jgi:Mg2+-importing ATPase